MWPAIRNEFPKNAIGYLSFENLKALSVMIYNVSNGFMQI